MTKLTDEKILNFLHQYIEQIGEDTHTGSNDYNEDEVYYELWEEDLVKLIRKTLKELK